MSEKEKALAELDERKKNQPDRVDNSRLYAGSPMYYYCKLCGHLAEILPEDHYSRPKQLCAKCQFMKDQNWLE